MLDVSTILRSLPYSDHRSTVLVRGREEVLKPAQIVIWASITDIDQKEFDPAIGRFPVVLDTGFSHNFAIKDELLNRWAGFEPSFARQAARHHDPRRGCPAPCGQGVAASEPARRA